MVTLFKTDKAGRLRCVTVHDLQRSLLGEFALTVSSAVAEKFGNDALHHFENRLQRDRWLSQFFARKRKAGYMELYAYGTPDTNAKGEYVRAG